jgi:hypothetical protein
VDARDDAVGRRSPGSLRGAVPALIALAVAVAIMLAWSLAHGAQPFYYDSGDYWNLGATFETGGHFSLLNFDSPLRGYLLPLIDHLLHLIASGLSVRDSTLAKIFNAVVLALIAAVLLPAFAERSWPSRRWGPVRRVLLAIILLLFWNGFLAFPLSDLPAVAAVLLALVAIASTGAPGWMLVTGTACGAAIDMRPAYILLAPVVAALVTMAWWSARKAPGFEHRRRAVGLILAVVGFVLVSAPQSLATHRHFHSWSFVPGSVAGLSSLQYNDGLRLQLYDTYVGTRHAPQMDFIDPSGTALLVRSHKSITSTSGYADLAISHPLPILGTFVRHVINGLDQRYSTPYIAHLRIDDWWMRFAGFAFAFLALARVAWAPSRGTLGPARWRYPIGLLLAGSTAIASAVETRFMLPAAFLSYVVVLAPGWAQLPTPGMLTPRDKLTGVGILVASAALGVLVVIVVNGATSHLQFG